MVDALKTFLRPKKATADLESLKRVFTAPEKSNSTLSLIEKEISRNIHGFLSEHIVSEELAPADLEKDFLDTRIYDDPIFVSEQAEFLLSKVVAQSVHTASPRFIGHMTSALPYFMLPLTKLMVALNQNLVKIETSKAFTPLERQVIAMLHRLVYNNDEAFYQSVTQDRNDAIGAFCSGGTVANVTALWVARNRLLKARDGFAGINQEGLYAGLKHYGLEGLAIIVSRRGHYSLSKAADLLGVGKRHLIAVDVDDQNKIKLDALKTAIADVKESRLGLIAVVGVAGTTETGHVDPLESLARIAKDNKTHFHVDAAWGGPTIFSEKHRYLLAGLEQADSVTFDAHKQLYVPMGAGMALFKDRTAVHEIEQHANYIIREGSRDLGKHTLEGSRPGMAMLVHSGLRIIGRKGYELLIDMGIEKAKLFARMINAEPDFELVSEPELNLLTYRYVPSTIRARLEAATGSTRQNLNHILNELTVAIQKEQRAAGKTFVSRTKLQPAKYGGEDTDVFRVVLANPLTTEEILRSVLDEQKAIAKVLIEDDFLQRAATKG